MSSVKRRVYISDHGAFRLFDMDISLPAIIELTDEQIDFINASGLYKINELNSSQSLPATPTVLSALDGDRFESARTISVNELSFKMPILGTQYAKKAKDAIIVKKNSIYAKAAIEQQHRNNAPEIPKETVKPTLEPITPTTPTVEISSTKDSKEDKKKKNNNNADNENRSDV